MDDSVKRSAIQFAIWLIITSAAVGLVLLRNPNENRIEVGAPKLIANQAPSRMWFSSGGELLGVTRQQNELLVYRVQQSAGASAVKKIQLPEDAVWAVSRVGDIAAFADGEELSITPVFTDAVKPVQATLKSAPKLLAVTDSGLVISVSETGSIEILDRTRLQSVGSGSVRMENPDSIDTAGTYVAIGSSSGGMVEVLDTRALPRLSVSERRVYGRSFTVMALSPAGRVAIATQSGPILADRPIPLIGPVTGIGFVDDQRVAVVGPFHSLKYVAEGKDSLDIMSLPNGGRIVAGGNGLAAAATGDGVQIVSVQEVNGLAEISRRAVMFWSITNAVALIVFLSRLIPMLAKRREAASAAAATPAVDPRNTLAEAAVPADLVQALASGSCLLIAGEGLSTAAGYPRWDALLKGFVDSIAERERLADAQVSALHAVDNMEALLDVLGEEGYYSLLEYARRMYSASGQVTRLHDSIRDIPFGTVLTSVFDVQIEKAFRHREPILATPADAVHLSSVLARNDFMLLRSRGDLAIPQTVSLTPPGPGFKDPVYTSFLSEAFTTRKVLIVAADLKELQAWTSVLSKVDEYRHQHYALVPVNGEDSLQPLAALSAEFRIQALTYPKADTGPAEQFLAKVFAALPEKRAASVIV